MRKKLVSATFVLLLAFQLLATPVTAQQTWQQTTKRLEFQSVAKGPGLVGWGAGVISNLVFGEEEYHEVFTKSSFQFNGSASVEKATIIPSSPSFQPEEEYIFIEGSVQAKGTLNVNWTHDGNSHELRVELRSIRETGGSFSAGPGLLGGPPFGGPDRPGYLRVLMAGTDADHGFPNLERVSDWADPANATITFQGSYRVNREEVKIEKGVALLFIPSGSDTKGESEREYIQLSLWIEELKTYVTFVWFSEEVTLPPTVPPAEIEVSMELVEARIKILHQITFQSHALGPCAVLCGKPGGAPFAPLYYASVGSGNLTLDGKANVTYGEYVFPGSDPSISPKLSTYTADVDQVKVQGSIFIAWTDNETKKHRLNITLSPCTSPLAPQAPFGGVFYPEYDFFVILLSYEGFHEVGSTSTPVSGISMVWALGVGVLPGVFPEGMRALTTYMFINETTLLQLVWANQPIPNLQTLNPALPPLEVPASEITLNVSDIKVRCGDAITVSGEGFLENSQGLVWFDVNNDGDRDIGEPYKWVIADKDGNFTTTLTTPDVPLGSYWIRASVGPSGGPVEASTQVAVTAPGFATILSALKDINATITGFIVNSEGEILAKIDTALGTLEVKLDNIKILLTAINATIVDIKKDVVTVSTSIGDVKAKLDDIKTLLSGMNATLTSLITNAKGEVIAAITAGKTTILAKLDALDATLIAVKGDVALIKTDVGTVKADVAAIKPTVVSIEGDVATIKTDVGTLKGTVTAIKGDVATITTDVGTMKVRLPEQISGAVAHAQLAVVLAGLACVGAWISVALTLRKKYKAQPPSVPPAPAPPTTPLRFCSQCGHQIPSEAKFCLNCGKEIE